ncbi:hypothetical protein ANCCAN_27024 [Ancylostoma caninum]|uniref:Uncharacterized protein n=1 Tax=Ancylostoma caninum TaxID=29170 RepID=A0A368F586_ANCCA|nr:hypothetical protein ANCCAN_27024 [Ancylostoma caninum]
MFNARSCGKSPRGRERKINWPFYEELMFLAPVATTGVRCTSVADTEEYEEAEEENISSGCVSEGSSRGTPLSEIQSDAVKVRAPTPQRNMKRAATAITSHPSDDSQESTTTATDVRSLSELRRDRQKRKKTKPQSGLDELTNVLKGTWTYVDRFESFAPYLASRLRELEELDAVTAERWMLKLNTMQIELSQQICDLMERRPST